MVFKTLLIGGLGTGKTTLLSSMLDECISGPLSQLYVISDDTNYNNHFDCTIESKKLEIRNTLELYGSSYQFLLDFGPNCCIERYTFKFFQPNKTQKTIDLQFTDVPGSYFQTPLHKEELINLIENHNAFVIALDTPYLMDAPTHIAYAVNIVDIIEDLLINIDDKEGDVPKMIIFAPIKCEKWIKEDRTKEVVDKIKNVFANCINMLMTKRTNICIMLMETIGGVIFSEFNIAYKLISGSRTYRCSKLSDSIVRVGDGSILKIKDGDIIGEDAAYYRNQTIIPNAWYQISTCNCTELYKPHHCDQMAIHLLYFFLKSTIQSSKTFSVIPSFPSFYIEFLQKIDQSNILSYDTNGIEYIKIDI